MCKRQGSSQRFLSSIHLNKKSWIWPWRAQDHTVTLPCDTAQSLETSKPGLLTLRPRLQWCHHKPSMLAKQRPLTVIAEVVISPGVQNANRCLLPSINYQLCMKDYVKWAVLTLCTFSPHSTWCPLQPTSTTVTEWQLLGTSVWLFSTNSCKSNLNQLAALPELLKSAPHVNSNIRWKNYL